MDLLSLTSRRILTRLMMTPVRYWRITRLDDLRDLGILYETFDVQGGRTCVAFAQDPTSYRLAACA